MQSLKQDHPDGFAPDGNWYRAFVAKLILFRTVQDVVKAVKFPAYQANIAAYTAALIAHRCGKVLKYEEIWNNQGISSELKILIEAWAKAVDSGLRQTAGMKMPTEWAKRPECWQALQKLDVIAPCKIPEIL